jgi:hypothetical protein
MAEGMLRKRKEPKAEKSVAEALLPDMQGTAVVGREGMAGLPIVDGADRSPCETSVQVEGAGQCISAQRLRLVMDQSITKLKCFLRYAHVFAVQSGYAALADARGNIEERLGRWLLMTRDRVDGNEMPLIREFIALIERMVPTRLPRSPFGKLYRIGSRREVKV